MRNKFLTLLILASIFVVESCNFSYYRKPDELSTEVLRAFANDNLDGAVALLPQKRDIVDVTYGNTGLFGSQYYNKYSESYNYANLVAKLTSAFEIKNNISKTNGLNWDDAKFGDVRLEEVNLEDAGYVRCSVDVKFPAADYIVVYNAIKTKDRGWFLADDIYLGKPVQK